MNMQLFITKYWQCIIGTLLIALDRISKLWALRYCVYPYDFSSWFSCEVVYNTGASFGLFAHAGTIIFWLLTMAIIVLLFLFAQTMIHKKRLGKSIIAEVLIIAGGIGNVIDRIYYRAVVDFIHVYYQQWSFPYFNIADMCIVCGVFLLVYASLISHTYDTQS